MFVLDEKQSGHGPSWTHAGKPQLLRRFWRALVVVECGGKAKRRHRCGAGSQFASRGSIHHAWLKFAPVRESGGPAARSPGRCRAPFVPAQEEPVPFASPA